MKKDLFKEFHKIHNKQEYHKKNNFVTGTSTINDEINKKFIDFVTIRLLPHQIFLLPKSWITSLANNRDLQRTGINFYPANVLKKVERILLFSLVICICILLLLCLFFQEDNRCRNKGCCQPSKFLSTKSYSYDIDNRSKRTSNSSGMN